MSAVKIRDLIIGEGMPKICVPIVEKTRDDILRVAEEITGTVAELVEWRADWFEDVLEIKSVKEVLCELRKTLGNRPLLFTFRTKEEGGERKIDAAQYIELNEAVLQTGDADLIDIEVFSQPIATEKLLDVAHSYGVKVIGSNHDFAKTPPKEEIIRRLCHMQKIGVDIAKIAVMPQTERDVMTLLEATKETKETQVGCPLVTMSMSAMGVTSRLQGEVYGSVITFGALGKVSAPGQINVDELKEKLQNLHDELAVIKKG